MAEGNAVKGRNLVYDENGEVIGKKCGRCSRPYAMENFFYRDSFCKLCRHLVRGVTPQTINTLKEVKPLPRQCEYCGTKIAKDNQNEICSPCIKSQSEVHHKVHQMMVYTKLQINKLSNKKLALRSEMLNETVYEALQMMASPRNRIWRGAYSDFAVTTDLDSDYVSQTFRRLVKQGKIEKLGRGIWRVIP